MPNAAQFIVPPFPGLLEELDFDSLVRTQPETREDWLTFRIYNTSTVKAHKDPLAAWEALVARVHAKPKRVVFATGFSADLDWPIYAIITNEIVVPVSCTGIFQHFYFRIQASLVKNGIPLPVVQKHLFALAKKERAYQARWAIGYEVQCGNVTLFDNNMNTGASLGFINGEPLPVPKIVT